MAKKGMSRIDSACAREKNSPALVPEIQGEAKHGGKRARPIIPGSSSPSQKVFHAKPHDDEKPISPVYKAIDNDLARDNLENDITAADREDL